MATGGASATLSRTLSVALRPGGFFSFRISRGLLCPRSPRLTRRLAADVSPFTSTAARVTMHIVLNHRRQNPLPGLQPNPPLTPGHSTSSSAHHSLVVDAGKTKQQTIGCDGAIVASLRVLASRQPANPLCDQSNGMDRLFVSSTRVRHSWKDWREFSISAILSLSTTSRSRLSRLTIWP